MPCCQQGWAIRLGFGYQGVDLTIVKLVLNEELKLRVPV
jgi:hypothetical protein